MTIIEYYRGVQLLGSKLKHFLNYILILIVSKYIEYLENYMTSQKILSYLDSAII